MQPIDFFTAAFTIAALLAFLLILGARTMSAITDLTANVAALVASNASLQTTLTTVQAELASLQGDDPAVVEANTAIVGVTQALDAANASLTPTPAA